MTKEDMKDLLLGKAIRYLEDKNIKFWKLVGKIETIVENNIHYESYDMDNMKKDLWKYCEEIKRGGNYE